MHFRCPGFKIRRFTGFRLRLPKLNFSSKVHYTRHRRSHYGSHHDDPYYQNSSLGYHCYDDVNSYNHRRYARIHHYRPLVSKDPEMISYDSLRMSLPPDSPNFCFIPLTALAMCGTPDEVEAIKSDHFNVTAKAMALLSRPYSVDQTSISVLHALVKELTNLSGTLLRGMEDPEDNGWYVPDFLGYGCLVGKSKQQRMDDFAEQEMEETADEIVVLWNKNEKLAVRGIAISFVDIGHSFCGFAMEVLPYISVPSAPMPTNPLHAAGNSVPGFPMQTAVNEVDVPVPTTNLMANPQFFVAPTAPPMAFSSAELKTMGMMSQTARGGAVDETEYDAAFTDATQDLNTQGEAVRTEGEPEGGGYSSFLMTVPDGACVGSLITTLSPEGVLYSISVPDGAPPGSTVIVNPGTLEHSDVRVTPYLPPVAEAAGEVTPPPPSYAQSLYHANVLDENDTTVPPPYSAPGVGYNTIPPPTVPAAPVPVFVPSASFVAVSSAPTVSSVPTL